MQAFANRDKLKPDMKNSIILSIHNDAFLSGFTRGSLEKLNKYFYEIFSIRGCFIVMRWMWNEFFCW